MTRRSVVGACVALVALGCGCGRGAGESGWELIPERAGRIQMRSFPDIPVSFPESPLPSSTAAPRTPIYGAFANALDRDSLFRRGYSAPTP